MNWSKECSQGICFLLLPPYVLYLSISVSNIDLCLIPYSSSPPIRPSFFELLVKLAGKTVPVCFLQILTRQYAKQDALTFGLNLLLVRFLLLWSFSPPPSRWALWKEAACTKSLGLLSPSVKLLCRCGDLRVLLHIDLPFLSHSLLHFLKWFY